MMTFALRRRLGRVDISLVEPCGVNATIAGNGK
jgi:hypothetical protein